MIGGNKNIILKIQAHVFLSNIITHAFCSLVQWLRVQRDLILTFWTFFGNLIVANLNLMLKPWEFAAPIFWILPSCTGHHHPEEPYIKTLYVQSLTAGMAARDTPPPQDTPPPRDTPPSRDTPPYLWFALTVAGLLGHLVTMPLHSL